MDPVHLPSLIPILQTLLKDRSPLSIGAVSIAFQTICPTRLDLLHTHYRRLCRTLLDADSWGQVNVLELLAKYARSMLPKPTVSGTTTDGDNSSEKDEIDPDLQLLLTNAEPLFMSNNPAVSISFTPMLFFWYDIDRFYPLFLPIFIGRYDCLPSFLLPRSSVPTFQDRYPPSPTPPHL